MPASKRCLVLAPCLLVGACASWPGMENPTLALAPKIALLRMTGATRMQSPGGSGPTTNPPSGVEQLGAGKRDEELGVALTYGDGFSGFEADYMLLDMQTSTLGVTAAPWGSIPGGVAVDTKILMDELRLRYIAQLFEWTDEDDEYWFKAGAGIQLAHHEMNFTVRQDGTSNSQKIEIKDDLSPYLALRLAGGRGAATVTLDLNGNDGWEFGTGDLDGQFYDVSVQANYYFEAQDLTVFGGYRRFDIPASGSQGPFRFDTDFTLDGLFFGLRFVF